jgi:hypothetical protein
MPRLAPKPVELDDEMTGIQALERQALERQALERQAPDKPMKPGQPIKREYEYIRHGTQTLIASFDISSGTIYYCLKN